MSTLRADSITNSAGSGSPAFPNGFSTPSVTNAGTLALAATGANVITASTNGTERFRIDASGRITMPAQPMFSARHNAIEAPATNGVFTAWTVDINQGGGAFSSGRYTAPVTGNYLITLSLLQNTVGGSGGINLVKNGTTVYRVFYTTGSTTGYNMNAGAYILAMAANDWMEFRQEIASISWYGDTTGLGAMTINMLG